MTLCHPRRDSKGFIALLDKVFEAFPAERHRFLWDNLTTHFSKESALALAALAEKHRIEVLPLPKYAAWLNLIEPWWKQLRGLPLKGRRFQTLDEVLQAIEGATDYWNQHRHPYIWGKTKKHSLPRK
jgi:transposase